MMIKVQLVGHGPDSRPEHEVDIQCGLGAQLLRWLGFVACSRLAYITGDPITTFVPAAIRKEDGTAMDVDDSIKNSLRDGAKVIVEYGPGPIAYKTRWEGRPPTPTLDLLELETPAEPDAWVMSLDLYPYGLEKEIIQSRQPGDKLFDVELELQTVRAVLIRYAGVLQAMFLWYSCQGKELNEKDFGIMAVDQFVKLAIDAKLVSEWYTVTEVNDCFHKPIEAKKGQKDYFLTITEFFVALVFLAIGKLRRGLEGDNWGYIRLAEKVYHLITDFILAYVGPELMARLEDLQESRTKEALTIVSESYGLIERCLQSCKPKRSPDDENLRIEVKQLLPYFQKWDILGGHFNLSLAAILTIYTLQVHSTNVQAKGVGFSQSLTNMSATAMPVTFNTLHLSKFLLGAAWNAYSISIAEKPFDRFLRDFLHRVFLKAGVVQPQERKKQDLGKLMEG